MATNLHVFKRASQAYVKVLGDGVTYKVADVLGIDMRRDLCVVRVDDTSTPSLILSGSRNPTIGDEVFVVGNPKGLEGSVSKGIVSSIRKNAGLIQIDAAISPGSSGGPVVNSHAEVIGIAVSSLVGGQNLNFAIPVDFLSALKLDFTALAKRVHELRQSLEYASIANPVAYAGTLSVSDKENDKLEGFVKSVSNKTAFYDQRNHESLAELESESKYDLEGNKVEYRSYSEGKLLFENFWTYDKQGFIVKYVDKSHGSRKERDLPPENSILMKLGSRTFGKIQERGKTYDSDGNLTEQILKMNDLWKRKTNTYGSHGFLAETKLYLNGKLKAVYRYKHETDQFGNWIKRYVTVYNPDFPQYGFTPICVEYREITYWQ